MYKKSLVFSAACLGMLLFGIGLITLGSVASDLKAKFQLNDINAGALFSILPIGILAGSLIFGPICDRFGYKLLLTLSCVGMFAGFEAIAYASSLNVLRISIFVFGVAGGAINGATNAVVADITADMKAANLSLLGVFFGIGALGMPLVLGGLRKNFSFDQVLAAVGFLTLAVAIFFAFIKFPLSKKLQGFPLAGSGKLFKDSTLILIGFFLFCQSGFEAILNNWTTTYLNKLLSVNESNALYALSLFVVGLTAMRLLTGSIFRSVAPVKILYVSLIMLLIALILLTISETYAVAVTALVLLGAGLAGGFPIMLGFVADRYAAQSATAFSFVLVTALIGNMFINYLMGVIAQRYGVQHLTTVSFIILVVMLVLGVFIFRKLNRAPGGA